MESPESHAKKKSCKKGWLKFSLMMINEGVIEPHLINFTLKNKGEVIQGDLINFYIQWF